MPGETPALKARLMAKAEARIDEWLTAQKPAEETKLVDIEQAVLGLGQRLQRALTAELVEAHTSMVEPVGADRPYLQPGTGSPEGLVERPVAVCRSGAGI